MNTEWTGQDSETSVRSPVLGVAGLLVRQKGPGGVSKEATVFGEEVYTVLTPESRGRGGEGSFSALCAEVRGQPLRKGVQRSLYSSHRGAGLHEVCSDGRQALVSSAWKRQACVEPF